MMFDRNTQRQNMFNNGGQPSLGQGGQRPQTLGQLQPNPNQNAYQNANQNASFQQPQYTAYDPAPVGMPVPQPYAQQRQPMTRDAYMQRPQQPQRGGRDYRRMMMERARRRQQMMMQQRQMGSRPY
jgi:hypothetical protein